MNSLEDENDSFVPAIESFDEFSPKGTFSIQKEQ